MAATEQEARRRSKRVVDGLPKKEREMARAHRTWVEFETELVLESRWVWSGCPVGVRLWVGRRECGSDWPPAAVRTPLRSWWRGCRVTVTLAPKSEGPAPTSFCCPPNSVSARTSRPEQAARRNMTSLSMMVRVVKVGRLLVTLES